MVSVSFGRGKKEFNEGFKVLERVQDYAPGGLFGSRQLLGHFRVNYQLRLLRRTNQL